MPLSSRVAPQFVAKFQRRPFLSFSISLFLTVSLSLSSFATCTQFLAGCMYVYVFAVTRHFDESIAIPKCIRRIPSPTLFLLRSFPEVRVSSLLSARRFAPPCLFFRPERLAFTPRCLSLPLAPSNAFTSVFTPDKTDDRFSCMNGVQRDAIVQSFSVERETLVWESAEARGAEG